MELKDILALQDIDKKIEYLKKRKTEAPNTAKNYDAWDPKRHAIMIDRERYPDGMRVKTDEWVDDKGVKHQAELEPDPINRIALPIEQDQVNIHTAFTVGNDPTMTSDADTNDEKELFGLIKRVLKKNKAKYVNKRVVRSWLSEQEVAEYWYTVEDVSFWASVVAKIRSKLGIAIKAENNTATRRLKVMIWSPFRGDNLYPLFDSKGKLVACSREYKVKNDENAMVEKFMTVTDDWVYGWVNDGGWKIDPENTFKHGFSKMPIIYSFRPETLCANIQCIRERLEELTSEYADCIDYNFYPRIVAEGSVTGRPTKENGDMIQISGGGKVYYLTWTQTPEQIKLEFANHMENIYAFTQTPRLTVEALKGIGEVPSGTAFRFVFMGTLIAVDNHAETIGEHLQRRVNFLESAIASLIPRYERASKSLDIEVEINPFTIDDMEKRISKAVEATGGPVASLKTGVILAGLVDNADEEVELIQQQKLEQAAIEGAASTEE